ncbi:hypothetical protein HD554DRAFT_2040106 [Boletus coccyginus]|nr:hypothetical protein HD554DRAFT_2040106 [Boletus coccyginus]
MGLDELVIMKSDPDKDKVKRKYKDVIFVDTLPIFVIQMRIIYDGNQIKETLLDQDIPPTFNPRLPTNIPESTRNFFASVSSPSEILSSKLISRVEGIDDIEGGYNHVHILNLDTAMEYIDGDILSDVWLDLPEEEKECMTNQVAEIRRTTMRTKTAFNMIGGVSPDGSACPLVDGVNVASGRVSLTWNFRRSRRSYRGLSTVSVFMYNTGPYESVQEYVQSVFDRQFHYTDQMLHKDTLSAHEAEFREIGQCLFNLSPEDAFERVKSKRDDFIIHPYQGEYPFVLRHGDLHGRNVIASWLDNDENVGVRVKQAEEVYHSQLLIDQFAGELPYDTQPIKLVYSTKWGILDQEALKVPGKYACASACLDDSPSVK